MKRPIFSSPNIYASCFFLAEVVKGKVLEKEEDADKRIVLQTIHRKQLQVRGQKSWWSVATLEEAEMGKT